jgi:hypothetical protein
LNYVQSCYEFDTDSGTVSECFTQSSPCSCSLVSDSYVEPSDITSLSVASGSNFTITSSGMYSITFNSIAVNIDGIVYFEKLNV